MAPSCSYLLLRTTERFYTVHLGKSTMLQMLPRLLSDWLRKGDEPCLGEIKSAMYGLEPLTEEHVTVSKALLAALKRAARSTGKYDTFLPLR